MKKKKRNRGRQPFEPTHEQRQLVWMAAAIGFPEERLVKAIINPSTKKPIDPKTLRLKFREELDRGMVEADIQVGRNLFNLTKTNAACAIFWSKVRLHWKETAELEIPLAPVGEGEDEAPENLVDTARRIAFMLTMGARQAQPQAKKS